MSEQILNVLETLRRQWGELYVTSQETTQILEQMQTHIAAIEKSANFWCNFSLICACVGFVLAIGVASLMVWRWMYDRT